MTEIGVHKDNIFTLAPLKSVDIGRSESHLAWSSIQNDLVFSIDSLEVLDLLLGAIRGIVIDNDHLHVDFPV